MPLELNGSLCDERKIASGVWWEIHINPDGTFGGKPMPGDPGDQPALLIRPRDEQWDRAIEDARRPHLIEIRDRRLDPQKEREMTARAIAVALWRGAQNVTVGGSPFVWSEDRAARMLAERRWWNLADFILAVSMDRAALAADEERKASGN
jgi:hypothetical protein